MDKGEKESILQRYYFDITNRGSFGGAKTLYEILKKKYPRQFTVYFIQKWLNTQDSYSLQKQVRHKFKTQHVRVSSIREQFDADLMSVGNLAKENDGIYYLLCVIDVFSRYAWIRPLKNKSAKIVLNAMKHIFKDASPSKLRTDKGAEFVNQWFKSYMKKHNIYYFTTQNKVGANYVERFNRTLRTRIFRMLKYKRNYRYIDDLQNIVTNYNSTPHRSLNYLAPEDINKQNEADVWAYMYLKKPKHLLKNSPSFKFKKNDYVRISFIKHPFRRAYQDQFTTEVFKIDNRFFKQSIPMYKLKDLNNEEIKGSFYTSELQNVDKSKDIWFIEKILKTKKVKGQKKSFVRWEGFRKQFDSWINANQIEKKL